MPTASESFRFHFPYPLAQQSDLLTPLPLPCKSSTTSYLFSPFSLPGCGNCSRKASRDSAGQFTDRSHQTGPPSASCHVTREATHISSILLPPSLQPVSACPLFPLLHTSPPEVPSLASWTPVPAGPSDKELSGILGFAPHNPLPPSWHCFPDLWCASPEDKVKPLPAFRPKITRVTALVSAVRVSDVWAPPSCSGCLSGTPLRLHMLGGSCWRTLLATILCLFHGLSLWTESSVPCHGFSYVLADGTQSLMHSRVTVPPSYTSYLPVAYQTPPGC